MLYFEYFLIFFKQSRSMELCMAASIPPSSLNYLQNSEDSIIYTLRQGKPDTKIPLTSGEDQRPLVPYNCKSGTPPIFAAMNALRKRIGANPAPEYAPLRETEQLISSFWKNRITLRAELTPMSRTIQTVGSLVNMGLIPSDRARMKADWQSISDRLNRMGQHKEDEVKTTFESILPFLQEFIDSEASGLFNYLTLKEQSTEAQLGLADSSFLSALKFDVRGELEKDMRILYSAVYAKELTGLTEGEREEKISEYLNSPPSYALQAEISRCDMSNPMSTFIKNNQYACIAALNAYGFTEASWHPSESITELKANLRLHGPLIATGAFGKSHYAKDPTVREKIEGRQIYGWAATDRIPRSIPGTQSIIIVGGKSGGSRGGYVYFVIPSEGSDPHDPNRQKIYVTTYEGLTSNIRSFKGSSFVKEGPIMRYPFAYYYNNTGS